MTDERLIVSLEARIRDFEKNMAKAERTGTRNYRRLRQSSRSAATAMERDMVRSTTRVNQALASTTTQIGRFSRAFAAGAVATGIGGLVGGTRNAIRNLAELDQQAKRAGVSVTAFQELKFVSEQSRIGVDQLVDGLKELSLRADEFVVTGKGPAAEAFKRMGFEAQGLKRALEDPKELFIDIVARMEDLDRAGQIRVADEVFGGTAGERFVELLDHGEDGIRKMINRAHDLGVVLDEEAIDKASQLDRKFVEISQRISNLGKLIVVNLAGGLEEALTIDVDDIFGSAERAIAMMGREAYDAMKDANTVTEEQRDNVRELHDTYEALFRSINAATGPDGIRLMDVADVDVAHDLAAILQDLDTEMRAFQTGAQSSAEFEKEVTELVAEAEELLEGLSDIDRSRFDNVIAAIGDISGALAKAIQNAGSLRSALPEREIIYSGRGADPRLFTEGRDGSIQAPETSLRPRLPSVDADFGDPSSSSRPGRGGGRNRGDQYREEVERTREAIALLQAEAVALEAVAASGQTYGDAIEYARKKAELLHDAQKAGKEITPELRAEIDELAKAYTVAGVEANEAADRINDIEEAAQRGADRLTDLFLGVIDGSRSAKDAVADLLLEIAKIQIQQSLKGLFASGGGNGIFGLLSGLLGFASGGYTGSGAANQPAGIVHAGEFVVRASEVRKPGVRSFLEAINNGQPGFARGGLAPGSEGGREMIVKMEDVECRLQ